MYLVQEICEEQERQYNQLMQEDDQYCHPESFKWGFEHGFEYALSKFGWHPASKLPPKSTRIIVCYKDKYNYDLYTSQSSFLTKDNEYIGVPEYAQKTLMWCYPPEQED